MMTMAVIPVLVGPLQVLMAVLPAILVALGATAIALFKPSTVKKLLKLLWVLKWQVGLVALGIAVLCWTGKRVFAQFAPAAGIMEAGTSDWPMTRGSLERTGAVPNTDEPSSGGIVWQHRKGNESFFASAAVVGNRVFVSVADMAALGQSGRIYAFDADTGRVAWTGAPSGYEPTFSSPVVSGQYVVCGEGLHWASAARVVCLDSRTGATVWTFRTKSHVECAPVIADDRVYVGAGDDGYYCLELKTGRQVWHAAGAAYPDAETALAVHDGKVYAGLGIGGAALCVLDAASGRELQRVAMPYPVFAPPSIADGRIYLGMGKGDYVKADKGGEVRCLDLATLKTIWSFPLDMTVLGSVAVKGDRLYFAGRDQHVYCLDRDGKELARFNARTPISAAPAVTDRFVYVVTEAGLLLALERETLKPVWDFRLGTKPLFISAPTIARGHVYVGTQEDGFLCVGELGQAREVATINDGSPLPGAGAFQWNYPADQQGGSHCVVTGQCVALAGHLYASLSTGHVRLTDGAEPKSEPVKTMPAASDGPIEIQGGNNGIVALDRVTRRPLWRVDGNVVTPATIVKNRFYIGATGSIECRSMIDGRLIWSRPASPLPGIAPLVSRDRLIFATKDALMILDLEAGDARPSIWVDTGWLGTVCGPMTLLNSKVYVPVTGWGLVCLGGAR
jgi:outer membrane protein assembly factor BamB